MVKLGQGGVQVLWWFATVCTLVDEAMGVATFQGDRDDFGRLTLREASAELASECQEVPRPSPHVMV